LSIFTQKGGFRTWALERKPLGGLNLAPLREKGRSAPRGLHIGGEGGRLREIRRLLWLKSGVESLSPRKSYF